ncbi:MAG: hypothetical protein ABI364_06100 [Caldimonas sp.]
MPTPRRVLVTSATSGIGAGIARAFSAAGDAVVITGVSDDEVASARMQPVVNCAGVIRRAA